MNDQRYQWILYTIVTVIITTIGIQVYWNYKNYQTNKQQLINDVQTSLDKAVDDYYAGVAQQNTIGVSFDGVAPNDLFEEGSSISTILADIDSTGQLTHLDSIDISKIEGAKIFRGFKADSLMEELRKNRSLSVERFETEIHESGNPNDSIQLSNFELLTLKVVTSITNDSLDLKKLNKLLNENLEVKKINLDHHLEFFCTELDNSSQILKDSSYRHNSNNYDLHIKSKSTFLPSGSILKLNFTNETLEILKRILGGIGISSLLVLAVISSLFYLLSIIKRQKQLAEVKNDLISNITHEFKTPIATISVALESINNFNAIEDKEKTKNYIKMSSEQLNKLHIMVEKLLETASLDSDNLNLKFEKLDLVELCNSLIEKYRIQFPERTFVTDYSLNTLEIIADSFHIENALNNILDNAVKYGGSTITIGLLSHPKNVEITISDNGTSLTKANKDQIFEKFYRVPKGNTHDVKGFGIGLYYTKTIVEKHHGSIILDVSKSLTSFKISLPNA